MRETSGRLVGQNDTVLVPTVHQHLLDACLLAGLTDPLALGVLHLPTKRRHFTAIANKLAIKNNAIVIIILVFLNVTSSVIYLD